MEEKVCLNCGYHRALDAGTNCPKCTGYDFQVKDSDAVIVRASVKAKTVEEPVAVKPAEKPHKRRLFGVG